MGKRDAASGAGFELKVGAGMGGITSVSYAGMTLDGETSEDRLDTRVVFLPDPAPAFPTRTFKGDFRGDFLGEWWTGARRGEARGCGVGGSWASIISTCQDRCSSSSRARSTLQDVSRKQVSS